MEQDFCTDYPCHCTGLHGSAAGRTRAARSERSLFEILGRTGMGPLLRRQRELDSRAGSSRHEAALVASYFGFRQRASNLETQYVTLANLRSGVDITDRSRAFRLAMGDFNSLEEYNDTQLRRRNWDRLFDETAENNWHWQSESDRNKYNQLRSDRDRARNQLPAILGLMTLNRVVSAISAYNRARDQSDLPEVTFTPILDKRDTAGVLATISFQF